MTTNHVESASEIGKKSKKRDRSPSVERLQKELKKIQEKLNRKGEMLSLSNSNDSSVLTSKVSGMLYTITVYYYIVDSLLVTIKAILSAVNSHER